MDFIKGVSSFPPDQKIDSPARSHPVSSVKGPKIKGDEYNKKMNQIQSVIQENLGITDCKLNFSVDQQTQTVVVKIFNTETGELIREIPPQEILALAKKMEELKGLLFNNSI